jgi:hypothetical protein
MSAQSKIEVKDLESKWISLKSKPTETRRLLRLQLLKEYLARTQIGPSRSTDLSKLNAFSKVANRRRTRIGKVDAI